VSPERERLAAAIMRAVGDFVKGALTTTTTASAATSTTSTQYDKKQDEGSKSTGPTRATRARPRFPNGFRPRRQNDQVTHMLAMQRTRQDPG
jgi:hypothetical protein